MEKKECNIFKIQIMTYFPKVNKMGTDPIVQQAEITKMLNPGCTEISLIHFLGKD